MDDWTYKGAGDVGLSAAASLRDAKREPGLVNAAASQLFGLASSTYLKLAHHLTVFGRENLPGSGPFVLAANHNSHLDALCLSAALPARLRHEAFPVAAGDTFFDTPAHAAVAAFFLNAVPLWRKKAGRHAMDDLRDKLVNGGCVLLLFPEGTRSRDGTMGRCKAGLGMLVCGTGVPVIPCGLRGTFAALPPGAKRPKFGPLSLRIGEPLTFADAENGRDGWDRVAGEVGGAVRALLEPGRERP